MIGTAATVSCTRNPRIQVRVLPGHFAMTYSHTNAYVDNMEVKLNQRMASEAAALLADDYAFAHEIDTIVAMDGTEVLGAFLAERLARGSLYTVNNGADIHVVTPELENASQMIFRDNLQPMIRGKKVLILCGSLLTGNKVRKSVECVDWYGGTVVGIAAVFSIMEKLDAIPVHYLFSQADLPEFQSVDGISCPLCKAGQKIDALANCYGYSKI